MLDPVLRKSIGPALDGMAGKVYESGLGANKLTLIGLAVGLTGCFCVAMAQFPMGIVLILIGRFLDALAAAVARRTGITARGSFLDVVSDFTVFGGFVFLFSLAMPQHLMAAGFVLFSYLMMAVAFLAHRLFSTDGKTTEDFRTGLVGGAEITVFMVICCLYPAGFSAVAAFMGLLCWTTTALRIRAALVTLD